MKVRDITSVLEEFAPLKIQEDWDNSGLCVGSLDQEVHGVMLGFDCTSALVDEAVEKGCDMIVTHHPLIFSGIRQIHPEDPVGLALMKAIRAGVAVYASHTCADKTKGGVSWIMAKRLNLMDIKVLDEQEDGIGLGAIGTLPKPMASDIFIEYVKERFGLKVLRASHLLDKPVSTVAMCGGAGSSLISKAMESGADAYICGDVSYHHFFTPKDFMVIDIGHFEGEVEIVDVLYSLIRKKFPTFAVYTSSVLADSNPVNYYV